MKKSNKFNLQRMYDRVYSVKALPDLLRGVCLASVIAVGAIFAVCLAVLARHDLIACLKLALAAAIPFVIVSVLRALLNSKRPYEVYDFSKMTEKTVGIKRGSSFPSRHVFSAFVIGALIFPMSVGLSVAAILLGVLIALCRVLLGVHFIKDVVVGAAVGIISGVLGILIL